MMTNEPAERLRSFLETFAPWHDPGKLALQKHEVGPLFDAALAAERRATVERIRAAVTAINADYPQTVVIYLQDLDAILDAEAER
jgi:hypothetical protein